MSPRPILLCDFDGTLTDCDVGDAVCDLFAPPAWRAIDERWVRHEISLPEAQREMWALVRGSRDEVMAGVRRVAGLRPGWQALLDAADARGIPMWLASGGFDFYIEALLGDALRRFERVYMNASRFDGDRVVVEFPHADLACDRCAVCKGRVCDLARAGGARVLFVGDGHSDRCVVGRADRVAAVRGSHLERWCKEHGQPCVPFDRLDELVPLLDGIG